jgi:regulator of sirC expression with transglutaminase-like and TPR domain
MLDKNKVEALISLLDETDENIYEQLKESILFYGIDIIPLLEQKWETTTEEYVRQRIENITHQIQFEDVCIELKNWVSFGSNDFLKGYIIISKYYYPELKEDIIIKTINRIVKDTWLELNDSLTPLEKIKVLNHIIFGIHEFSSSIFNYNSPQNLFLNVLLETKRGNSLSLGLLYIIIANKLGLPIYGVNLPEHFIIAYINENTNTDNLSKDDILFYINPFSRGAVFTKLEINMYIKHLKLPENDVYYQPCNNIDLLVRLLENLNMVYSKSDNTEKVNEITTMLNILKS